MNLNKAFKELISYNNLDYDDNIISIKGFVKKLNKIYYGIDCDSSYCLYAGSFGRGTAISASDCDFCYILPNEVFARFESRKGNIQSQLICEVKETLQEKYPNSDIKGDGQVIDINFSKGLFEIVPCFRKGCSNELIFPDTHNEGSWKTTNPKNQIEKINSFSADWPLYKDTCKLLRCWKAEQNVSISGIQIDMLILDFFKKNIQYKNKVINDIDFICLLKDVYLFLSSHCPTLIMIEGDNEIIEVDVQKFCNKSKKALRLLSEESLTSLWDNCLILFGCGFPDNPSYATKNTTEEFIQNRFPIRICNLLKINCNVSADGFMVKKLKDLLSLRTSQNRYVIDTAKNLEFYIEECNVDAPYDIYWKVRNIGEIANKRNQIRGAITKGGNKHKEKSLFQGPHFVECYIVKDGKCVARDRIEVPIK